MSTLHESLRAWVRVARGAVEWHQETGDSGLPTAAGYQPPPLGRIAAHVPAPRPVAAPVAPPQAAVEATEPVVTLDAPQTSVPVEVAAPASDVAARAGRLQTLRDEIGECRRCPLCDRRQEVVCGFGRPDARLMFVGEAPGDPDDATGTPFVDEAGQLLTRMVHAMGLRRADVYLAHVVMCRPPGRAPEDEEVRVCSDFLRRQVEIVGPECLVALGSLPARLLTGRDAALARLQGEWGEFAGVPVMSTFPLEAMLQNPRLKGAVWGDLKKVIRRLQLEPPKR